MKVVCLSLVWSIIFSVPANKNCTYRNTEKIEYFKQNINDENANKLELVSNGDSVYCIFHGVELSHNGDLFYYKSYSDRLKFEDNKMYFHLNEVKFSSIKFGNKDVDNQNIQNRTSVPLILKFTQNFSGEKKADTLLLTRSSLIYDANVDKYVFIKVKKW